MDNLLKMLFLRTFVPKYPKSKNNHAMQLLINPTNSNLVLNLDMSLTLIHQYYNEKFKLKNVAKQDSESVLRRAFARLLEGFAQKKN
jgi:hypothetical protein